jgi:hypothetical protein
MTAGVISSASEAIQHRTGTGSRRRVAPRDDETSVAELQERKPTLDTFSVGKTDLPVALMCRSKAALRETPNQWHFALSRARKEGRFAIVTDVGCGMRWTR